MIAYMPPTKRNVMDKKSENQQLKYTPTQKSRQDKKEHFLFKALRNEMKKKTKQNEAEIYNKL